MRYRFADTQAGVVGGKLYAVHELYAGPRVLRQEQVPVEVDVVEEARHLRARRNRQARLVHAAEHEPQPERATGMGEPNGLTDPARLGELDRQPVRPLGAGGHVGERVAVLVDVDRQWRAALQLDAAGVAGGQRLLAVLDPELTQL